MKSTNAVERVKVKDILDQFCVKRNLWYEPIFDIENIDARIMASKNYFDEPIGLAKIKSSPCNWSTNPAVGVEKGLVDFLHELSLLSGKKVALIIKFRDAAKYIRLEEIDKLPTAQKATGKRTQEQYMFPVQILQDL